MARLYSNENFPVEVIVTLREFGHDVLTSIDVGNANAQIPDETVLAFSIETERALLTLNRWDLAFAQD